jgi:hypothetical protein
MTYGVDARAHQNYDRSRVQEYQCDPQGGVFLPRRERLRSYSGEPARSEIGRLPHSPDGESARRRASRMGR